MGPKKRISARFELSILYDVFARLFARKSNKKGDNSVKNHVFGICLKISFCLSTKIDACNMSYFYFYRFMHSDFQNYQRIYRQKHKRGRNSLKNNFIKYLKYGIL